MINIKQNKKYLVVFCIVVCLFFTLCSISAFADYDFIDITYNSSTTWPTEPSVQLGTKNNSPVYYWKMTDNTPVYSFFVGDTQYFATPTSNVVIHYHSDYFGANWVGTSTTVNLDSTGLYYSRIAGYFDYSSFSSNLNQYATDHDGFTAVTDYIENGGGSSSTSSKLNYSLPPGNAAFIEVASDNTFTLNTRFNEMSGLFNGVFSKTSQTWGWSNTIVESGSYPLSGHNLIPWAKGDNQNLLGQSHFGYATSNSLSGSGKYLVIYNPLYSYQEDSNSNFEHNFSIDINCTSVYSISIVSLKGNLASGIESSWTLTSTPDGTLYTDNGIDADTGIPTFVDQNGDDAIPEYGGSNFVATQTESFKEWLNSVVGSFLSIFTAGENAIMTLVHSGQGFFSVLTSLYAWLPQSVFSVLTSGIVLVITIGIIKVFL